MQTGKRTGAKGSAAISNTQTHKVPRRRSLEKGNVGYLMIAPFIIFFLLFSLYPILNTIWLSFTDTTLMNINDGKYNGTKNFQEIFKDRFFFQSISNTWKMWLMNFIPQLGISMVLSVWFTSSFLKIKGIGLWRSLFYLPNLLLPVTVAVLFVNIFDLFGPANQFFVSTGFLSEPYNYLRSKIFSQSIVAFIQWWMWYGNTIIILVAGMTSISVSFYESAMIDGANGGKMFRYITLPSLRPILVYTLVTSLVGGMQMFDIPFLISQQGDPDGSIKTMMTYMINKKNASVGFLGSSAAVGFCLLIITSVCSILIFYLLRDRDAIAEKKARKILQREQKLSSKAVR